MKNNIDSNFAIAILALVAACIGFSIFFNAEMQGSTDLTQLQNQNIQRNANTREKGGVFEGKLEHLLNKNGDQVEKYKLLYHPESGRDLSSSGEGWHWPIGAPFGHGTSTFRISEIFGEEIQELSEGESYYSLLGQLVLTAEEDFLQSACREMKSYSDCSQRKFESVDLIEREVVERGDRRFLSEELSNGSFRCVYMGERLNADYVVIYSTCGAKNIVSIESVKPAPRILLQEELVAHEEKRIEGVLEYANDKDVVYYVFQDTIRSYDRKTGSETVIHSGDDVSGCSQLEGSSVLTCANHGYEYYSPTYLYFLDANKFDNLEGCWTAAEAVRAVDDSLVEVKCLEGESTYLSSITERDVTEVRYYNSLGQIVKRGKNTVDLCNDEPIKTEIGSLSFPIDIKYRHMPYLGEVFTAYECGPERVEELPNVSNGIYDFGSIVDLKGTYKSQLGKDSQSIQKLKDVGYVCANNSSSPCMQWLLESEVGADDLMKIEPLYHMIERDDCVHCG